MLGFHRVHVIDSPNAAALEHDEPDLCPFVEFRDHLVGHEIRR